MALAVELTVDHGLLADDTHERDVGARPFVALGDLVADDLEPFDHRPRHVAPLHDGFGVLLFVPLGMRLGDLALQHDRMLIGARHPQVQQLVVLVRPAEILALPHIVLVVPAGVLADRVDRGRHVVLQPRVIDLCLLPRPIAELEAEFGVRPVELLDVRIEVDLQRVPLPPDEDFLVERAPVDIVRGKAPISPAAVDLAIGARVIGLHGPGLVFDVPNDALEDCSSLHGRTITNRADLDLALVLPLVVEDLQVVLAGLVDRQGWLLLPRAGVIGGGFPLPPVVAVGLGELDVSDETSARDALPFTALSEPLPSLV